jgi:hypothetical protein
MLQFLTGCGAPQPAGSIWVQFGEAALPALFRQRKLGQALLILRGREMKRGLQLVLGLLLLMTLFYGVAGLLTGVIPYLKGEAPPLLDNQFRYAAGVYLVFSFLLIWIIPNIERHKTPLRIICAALTCGGIGRLISIMVVGSGHVVQLVLMVLELGAPLLMFWQAAVARRAGGEAETQPTP